MIPEKGNTDHRKQKRSNGIQSSQDWKLALEFPYLHLSQSHLFFCLSNLLPALDFPVWQTNRSVVLALYCFSSFPADGLIFPPAYHLCWKILLVPDLFVSAQKPILCVCLSSESCGVRTAVRDVHLSFFACAHSKKAH